MLNGLKRISTVVGLLAVTASVALGQGTGANPNQATANSVANALRASRTLSGSRIEIEAQDGMVTLTGLLASPALKEEALARTQRVAGIRGVIDRLQVSDREGNDPETALVAEELSDVVVVDHSPPRRRAIERRGDGARLTVADDLNPLVSAEISLPPKAAGDYVPWRPSDDLFTVKNAAICVHGAPPFDAAALPLPPLPCVRIRLCAYAAAPDLTPDLAASQRADQVSARRCRG